MEFRDVMPIGTVVLLKEATKKWEKLSDYFELIIGRSVNNAKN